ncbi:hypothetical protein DL96DRAFT_1537019 [Flagelloscypha sp. PMI_526]|nr:hypothetical protein DL96DRAFT_1537019 [Flagelloscypha sp. PMI_526]
MTDTQTTSRTLCLCFDGTASEYGSENTNVVRFFSLLRKDVKEKQLCYYQAGVGTFFAPGIVSPLLEWWAKVLDSAFAWYLDAHVMDGYRFLMQNYQSGDKICLFGFSRGAYTARALAGMLHKVGLIQRDNEEQISFAYKLYKRTDDDSVKLSAGFKQTFAQDVPIEFVGAWETVASVGIISGMTLPFTNANTSIKTFRHALALDEHRARFRPNTFRIMTEAPPNSSFQVAPRKGKKRFRFFRRQSLSPPSTSSPERDLEAGSPSFTPSSLSAEGNEEGLTRTDALEVWFPGVHADVGGGAVKNEEASSSLSSITLRWMVRQVQESSCEVLFNTEALERLNISLPREKDTDSGVGTSPTDDNDDWEKDAKDALLPIHDKLVSDRLWWLVEILPLHYTWQDDSGVWHSSYGFNLGKGRIIDDVRPTFHESVKVRLAASDLHYTPKAIWRKGAEVYVK